MIDNLVYYAALLVTLTYLTAITVKFGWLPSISKSYYKLKHNWIFTLFMWFVGGAVMYLGGKDSSTLAANTFYIGGAFLLYVGVFPRFEEDQATKHYLCALAGIVITLIGFIFRDHNYLPIIALAISALTMKRMKVNNLTFWVEVAFIVIAFLALA